MVSEQQLQRFKRAHTSNGRRPTVSAMQSTVLAMKMADLQAACAMDERLRWADVSHSDGEDGKDNFCTLSSWGHDHIASAEQSDHMTNSRSEVATTAGAFDWSSSTSLSNSPRGSITSASAWGSANADNEKLPSPLNTAAKEFINTASAYDTSPADGRARGLAARRSAAARRRKQTRTSGRPTTGLSSSDASSRLHARRPSPLALEVEPRATERGEAEQGEASEEQWAHRINRRLRALKIGKATMEYRWYSEQKREDSEPLTPDPTDRSLSARGWKNCVAKWRYAFHQQFLKAVARESGRLASADDDASSV